ncbi:MAG TPA: TonB-dependent receptor, partial [Candidatus Eremiobacteraceae bacterium]|nr:TonB-dependent receptor [Candidatus Eremiobacteraceae bacterium]
VNSATQTKVATLGGSGALDQAYGAIASQPGVVVPPGQVGWMQNIHIRGGDFDQVGYEFDGVPTLRSYDDYASTSLSSLGQQELQVYTGGAPANSESQGLAGYVNQVIKSGTYPGFADMTLGIGAPTMYNKLDFEAGGATANRSFSYYVAFGNTSQDFRYFDQFNGASLTSMWGSPFATLPCPVNRGTSQSGGGNPNLASCYAAGDIGPGGYVLGPAIDNGEAAQIFDHESIANVHFAIPHKSDSGKDDVQLLYDNTYLHTLDYSSASDWNVPGNAFLSGLNGGGAFGYLSGPVFGWQYLGQVGQSLPSTLTLNQLQQMVNPVYFAYNPDSQKNLTGTGGIFAPIPTDLRDGSANPNSIIKLQYQRNISSDSYIRVYGFQNWSSWPQTCPNTGYTNFVGYCPLNYFVSTYTSGVSTQYANQINDKNLLNLEVSDFWATDYRANDDTMINELEGLNHNTGLDSFLYLVNSKNPTNGVCYTSAGVAVSCYSGNAATVGLCQAGTGGNGVPELGGGCLGGPVGAMPSVPGSCGGAACAWFVAENGRFGGGNYAKPNFGWASVQDQWKPSQSLLFNVGARFTRYAYDLSDTGGPARSFWFNSWNNSYCVLPGAGHVPFYNSADDGGSAQACPVQNGIQTVPATMTNQPNAVTTFTDLEPRVGGTYTYGENDVFRFNYGRYNQPPNTAYEQYNLLQQDLASYDASHFWPIGFTTTTHVIRPPTANNYDVSWEHRFANSNVSFKLTPYLRTTRDQIQNFFLDPKTGFVSGLNAGEQTSAGFEFELNQGDFNRNGLASLLSFTFNHSLIRYTPLQNGSSVLSSVNLYIQQYNSYTKACAGASPSSNPNSLCGTYGGSNAVATETNGIANPYYDAPSQPLIDLNGSYQPYTDVPNAIGLSDFGYEVPVSVAAVINFKHDKWAITPEFQYQAGGWYGDPLQNYGVNPASCSAALNSSGSVSGDPRYPYGGTGNPYDALTCGDQSLVTTTNPAYLAIPDPYTGKFDTIGAFREPNHFLMHMQMSYELSSRTSLVANFSNIINRCSGGSVEPWTRFASSQVCQYTTTGYVTAPTQKYGANFYNPGSQFQPETQFPYQENPFITPFEATFQLQIKM